MFQASNFWVPSRSPWTQSDSLFRIHSIPGVRGDLARECEAVAAAVAVNQVQDQLSAAQEESWMTPLQASRLFGETFLYDLKHMSVKARPSITIPYLDMIKVQVSCTIASSPDPTLF